MVQVRRFRPSDAAALAAIFHASVRQGARRHYTAEQLAAWSPAPPAAGTYNRRADEHALVVALDDEDHPVGYADLGPDGYMDHLYCRPDRIGTGVGSALYEAIEAAAVEAGMVRLFVDASEAARLLFERRGFQVERRQDFAIRGVAIHNYRMSKALAR